MEKIILTNSGIIYNSINQKNDIKNNKFNIGFITSATGAMVNDVPEYTEIQKDVSNIKVIDNEINMSSYIYDYIVNWTLRNNVDSINYYFKKIGKNFNSYNIKLKDFKVNWISKCGVLIKNNEIKQIRKMALNDTHYQQFDKDFLGFFLKIGFSGKIIFLNNKVDINENIKYLFSNIPILCFKSENAFKNTNKEIVITMLKEFSNTNIEVMFI